MSLLYFILFFAVTWLGLMQIYRFSTYHQYFKKAAPVLAGYAVLVGALLYFFNLHEFFFWHLGLSALFLYLNYKKQPNTLSEADKTRVLVELSLEKTLRYHLISSVTYILLVSVTYLILFNIQ